MEVEMRKRIFAILSVLVIFVAVFSWLAISPIKAEEKKSASGDMGKVLENQQKILARLDEMKAELDIIRVRVSMR